MRELGVMRADLDRAMWEIHRRNCMPSGQELKEGGVKHDESKRRMDLIPVSSLNALSSVLGFGANKYGDHNWTKGLAFSRVYAACLRHLTDYWGGQDLDPESGLPHLHHAMCNLAFLIEFCKTHPELDDRQNGTK